MAPQLLFLTLTVLAVGAVVLIDRVAGRLAGDDDDVATPQHGHAERSSLPSPDASDECDCSSSIDPADMGLADLDLSVSRPA